ncbi:MAG: hypothetical protein HYZ81_02590 [Nitrospinae bacterium]|nr:hypothetical protein [Nitrospinota bacterium]
MKAHEERIEVWQFTYGTVRTDVQLALFADVGRVFHSFGELGSRKLNVG